MANCNQTQSIIEGTTAVLLGQLKTTAGAYALQADVLAMELTVNNEDEETYSGTVVVADAISDTMQTDDRWTRDSTGYNVNVTLPAEATPSEGQHHAVIRVDFVNGDVAKMKYPINAENESGA